MKKNQKVVLSASRMTDMPAFYPIELIQEVRRRIEKGQGIHTLVLWTKHPGSLLRDPLKSFLLSLREHDIQLYLQLTITGLGGLQAGLTSGGKPLILEPHAPSCHDSLEMLPQTVELVGRPDRIRLRVDPIVRIQDSKGVVFSSLRFLPAIVKAAGSLGIRNCSFSFLEANMHKKVDRRFKELGCSILPPDSEERQRAKTWIKKLESKFGVTISACCVSGYSETKCIDGALLSSLHDNKEPVDLSQPRKRERCGCTHSIDIGGWPPRMCFTGCDYCYGHANYTQL